MTVKFWSVLLAIIVTQNVCSFVPTTEFFVYGPENGDSQLPIEDDNFINVVLKLGNVFNFFNSSYNNLFVNNNGAISFLEGVRQYTPTCEPLTVPMIVPFWADVDTRNGGTVNYRETTNRNMLLMASEEIRRTFPVNDNIDLGWAFVITWDEVAFFGANASCGGREKRNTFQTTLTTDGSNSFAILFYNKVEWTTGTSSGGDSCTGLGGTPAKAGFDVGDGRTFFDIAGTCTADILNIAETTNVGQPGKWIFKIDNEVQSSACLDSAHAALQQLRISPSFMSIFGNNPITLRGPCMDNASRVQCRFNDMRPVTVDAAVSSDSVATCTVPYLYKNGMIKIDLLVTLTSGTIETFYGYIFTIKPTNELNFDLFGTDEFTMFWDMNNFGAGDTSQVLELELIVFMDEWISVGVIKEHVINTGSFAGVLNELGVMVIRSLRNLYMVKLRPQHTNSSNVNSIFSQIKYSLVGMSETTIDGLCSTWYNDDVGVPTDILPCPPLLQQAMVDERFEAVDDLSTFNPGAEQGFRQRIPSPSGAGQRCTYRDGSIIVGPLSGGTAQLISPNGEYGVVRHAVADLIPWYTCCQLTTNAESCRKYYERRPSDSGANYTPPIPSWAIGDPHISTFDMVSYSFNGVGEFWMVKSRNDSFWMQGRMTQFINNTDSLAPASVFTAFAMQQQNYPYDSVNVQVLLTLSGIQIILNGEVLALDRGPDQHQPLRNIVQNGVSIAIYSSEDVGITFSSGYSFKFSVASSSAINILSMVNANLFGQTKGLFGVFDGNRSNDFTDPDGVVVDSHASLESIHYDFGMKWRTTPAQSLFTYPNGRTHASYQNVDFVPNFEIPIENILPEDQNTCMGSWECLFDLYATGSVAFANSTREAAIEFNEIVKTLNIKVGVCTNPIAPENGYLQAVNYLVGSTVTVICNENYVVSGNDMLSCTTNSDGLHTWDSIAQCIPIESSKSCANKIIWLEWLCSVSLLIFNLCVYYQSKN